MLHPATRLSHLGGSLGTAVVASERIPAGSLAWVQDDLDRTLKPERVAALPPPLRAAVQNHGYFDRAGRIVLCWDNARYVNHSCDPNCISPGYGFEIAVRDIEPDEPLTNDYLALNLKCEFECQCGKPSCRHRVQGADTETLTAAWDQQLEAAMRHVFEVPQPLIELVTAKDRKHLEEIAAGLRRPRSSRWHVRSPLNMPGGQAG